VKAILARRGRASFAAGAALVAVAALTAPAASAAPSKISRELRTAAAPGGELRGTERTAFPGGAVIYRFQQRVDGRPVMGAQAIVDDAPGAQPRLVADSTRPAIDTPAPARIAQGQAIEIASGSVGVTRLRGKVSAALAIQPGERGTLVWRVLIPATRPLGDFEVLVDAATGNVVSRHDLLERFRTGKAKLYDPNPVVEHRGAKGLWSDHHDRDTPLLRRLRRKVRLPNIDDGQHCLRGRWVHVLRGRKERETCKGSLRWGKVTRSDSRFEALMLYFQINRAQAYVQSLGFSDSNPSPNGIDDHAQRAVADAFGPDQSYYSPITQVIEYGSGGVDDAEDADVILHEYAHAMQDSQSPAFGRSFGSQPGALAEGSSDYWAAAMSSFVPHSTNEDDVCIFDWDATSYGRLFPPVGPSTSGRRCGRRADSARTLERAKARCPRVIYGGRLIPDPHCVGEVWSSALWDIRKSMVAREQALGAVRMDKVYLASQFLYTGTESFKDAAKALLCVDEDLHPRGAPGDCRGEDYSAIRQEMAARRIVR
jgi:hypothetical protein